MTLVSQMYLQNKNVMVRYRRSRVPPKIEYRRQILLKLSFLGECDFIIYGQFALVKARVIFLRKSSIYAALRGLNHLHNTIKIGKINVEKRKIIERLR